MPKNNLVIVESPAKAKTIAGFLGSEFEVKSSLGHLRDLPSRGLGIDIESRFEPTYEVDAEKKKLVSELKKAAKGAEVWLATDEDREGEAIAWHLCQVLGLNPDSVKRIVFHEITKPAIEAAVKNPRQIDMALVDSQQARRILDRLVGYELSPVLWKKIRTGLSAGRVQSVAVRLLVEREKEIRAFKPTSDFKVTAELVSAGQPFAAELDKRLDSEETARGLLIACQEASLRVADISERPGTRSASAPFTTSTLQQEAARRLGFGVRQTMRVAQKLYEAGLITYMRTDSTSLSALALKAAQDHIVKSYGEQYYQKKQHATKVRSAQEAHEAIRPTDFSRAEAGSEASEKKLYNLIWRRALASQMAPARLTHNEARIAISGRSEAFIAKGQVLNFDGFMKVYGTSKDDVILPPLKIGQQVEAKTITARQTLARAASRYSEAALVRKLEQLGIGRPSTYAPTISTIQDRGYVEKKDLEGEVVKVRQLKLENNQLTEADVDLNYGADRQKLVPTELAEVVTDFLVKYFEPILDYGFTAQAEEELDQIADHHLDWRQMLEKFYQGFHPLIKKSESASREEASGARVLGTDPKTGQEVTARLGRFGPVLQLGEGGKDTDNKPTFAPMPPGMRLEEITLEQALPMFELPRVVGTAADGQEITASIGRFGPYLKVGKQYVSLKEHNPLNIDEALARQLISEHQEQRAQKIISDFGEVRIQNGPYGPYITNGQKNARIPKGTDPKAITAEEAKQLLDKAPLRRRPRSRRSK